MRTDWITPKRTALSVVSVIVLFLFLGVWPTLYTYQQLHIRGAYRTVRVNRITQSAAWLSEHGWVSMEPPPKAPEDRRWEPPELSQKPKKEPPDVLPPDIFDRVAAQAATQPK